MPDLTSKQLTDHISNHDDPFSEAMFLARRAVQAALRSCKVNDHEHDLLYATSE